MLLTSDGDSESAVGCSDAGVFSAVMGGALLLMLSGYFFSITGFEPFRQPRTIIQSVLISLN